MLNEAGLFPPSAIGILGYHLTPDYWGVTVFEAESAEAAFTVINIWRTTGTGFFKSVKMSLALTVHDSSALHAKMFQSVQEAAVKMK